MIPARPALPRCCRPTRASTAGPAGRVFPAQGFLQLLQLLPVPRPRSGPGCASGEGCQACGSLTGKGLVDTRRLNGQSLQTLVLDEASVSGRGPWEAWPRGCRKIGPHVSRTKRVRARGQHSSCVISQRAPDATEVATEGYLSACREVRPCVRPAGKSIPPPGKLSSKKHGTSMWSETRETGSLEPPGYRGQCWCRMSGDFVNVSEPVRGPGAGPTPRPVHRAGSGRWGPTGQRCAENALSLSALPDTCGLTVCTQTRSQPA